MTTPGKTYVPITEERPPRMFKQEVLTDCPHCGGVLVILHSAEIAGMERRDAVRTDKP